MNMLVYEPDCILWFAHILAVHGSLLRLTRDSTSKINHGTVYLYHLEPSQFLRSYENQEEIYRIDHIYSSH
jgi:hypothetical protein